MLHKPISGIYKIESNDGKLYIGSAIDINKRWKHHLERLKNNKHANKHLQNAYNKHGIEFFSFSILELIDDKTKLLHFEQLWLDIALTSVTRDLIYNIATIAGSHLGIKRSQETKDKMRKPKSLEARAKMSESAKLRGLSPERQALMAKSRIGGKRTIETRKKMSESGVIAWKLRKT